MSESAAKQLKKLHDPKLNRQALPDSFDPEQESIPSLASNQLSRVLLSQNQILHLQRTIGNQATLKYIESHRTPQQTENRQNNIMQAKIEHGTPALNRRFALSPNHSNSVIMRGRTKVVKHNKESDNKERNLVFLDEKPNVFDSNFVQTQHDWSWVPAFKKVGFNWLSLDSTNQKKAGNTAHNIIQEIVHGQNGVFAEYGIPAASQNELKDREKTTPKTAKRAMGYADLVRIEGKNGYIADIKAARGYIADAHQEQVGRYVKKANEYHPEITWAKGIFNVPANRLKNLHTILNAGKLHLEVNSLMGFVTYEWKFSSDLIKQNRGDDFNTLDGLYQTALGFVRQKVVQAARERNIFDDTEGLAIDAWNDFGYSAQYKAHDRALQSNNGFKKGGQRNGVTKSTVTEEISKLNRELPRKLYKLFPEPEPEKKEEVVTHGSAHTQEAKIAEGNITTTTTLFPDEPKDSKLPDTDTPVSLPPSTPQRESTAPKRLHGDLTPTIGGSPTGSPDKKVPRNEGDEKKVLDAEVEKPVLEQAETEMEGLVTGNSTETNNDEKKDDTD